MMIPESRVVILDCHDAEVQLKGRAYMSVLGPSSHLTLLRCKLVMDPDDDTAGFDTSSDNDGQASADGVIAFSGSQYGRDSKLTLKDTSLFGACLVRRYV